MERKKLVQKGNGELTIRYYSQTPPDPDNEAMKFAREVVDNGKDVTVEVFPDQETNKNEADS